MEEMLAAIGRELVQRQGYIPPTVETIYFGGGTPSLLSSQQTGRLLNQIRKQFNVAAGAEITLEANPEDINERKARALADLGINRVSLGVQSFHDPILQKLNRQHSGQQAGKAIAVLQNQGIANLTIDLIYGIPGQNTSAWEDNLQQALALNVPHLSCYALTIEEKTALGNWQRKGKFKAADEAAYEEQYGLMCQILAARGYAHYEVSNFARPGFASRHNMAYWQQKPYLGVGPGAHSYQGKSRQFNISHNARYIKALKQGTPWYQQETLNKTQVFNEYLLTGLRTSQGIDFNYIRQAFNRDIYSIHRPFIERCLSEGKATLADGKFVLKDNALILADSVIVELMMDDQ